MNRKAQFIAGIVITLMLPDAWSQTRPTSFMAVPGDGRATLRWDSVPNATGYNVKQATSTAGALTVIATNVAESSFVITNLGNGSTYSFAVSAVADLFQSADTPLLRIVPSGPVLDLLPAGAKLEKLVTGIQFTEGAVWIPEQEGYLIFSDVDGNAMYRWSPTAGKTVFRKPSNSANGNTLDLQGRLLTCEPQVGHVVRTESDGTVTPLVTSYNGKPFNGPNDIVVKSDGTIWFTDPVDTDRGWNHQPGPAVFRFDPATQQITPVATNFTASANYPNGLCFSPDESKLYLTDAGAIFVYDVLADGTLTNNRIFATLGILPQWTDGIRCDRAGRIFCTLGGAGARSGVLIYDPNGQLLGTIRTLEFVTNLCFGGTNQEMIFVNAGDGVYGITRMPDLIVTALNRIPANPTAGQPVTFSATVKNQGTGPTPNGVATLVAFSVDGATNIVWSDGFTASIPPDASVILTANAGVAGSTWPATAGSHVTRARVDDLGRIAESNETNNVFSATLTVSAPPPDNDGDGLDDASEALAGTDATDGTSVLKILAAERRIDDRPALTWSSVPGKSYRIARKSNIDEVQWASSLDVIPAAGAATSWTNSLPINGKPAFFRILVIP